MKISELIKELEAIKAVQGDIDVRCWPYDGQAREYSPKLEVHFSAKDDPLFWRLMAFNSEFAGRRSGAKES